MIELDPHTAGVAIGACIIAATLGLWAFFYFMGYGE